MRVLTLALVLLAPVTLLHAEELTSVEDFVRLAQYTEAVISPNGEYLAVRAPEEDKEWLVVLDIRKPERIKIRSRTLPPDNQLIFNIFWVNEERVAFETTKQIGALAQPRGTGKIYAVNADGKKGAQIYGIKDGAVGVGRAANVLSILRSDPDHILVAGIAAGRESPHAERINVYNGRRTRMAVSTLENGGLVPDSDSVVRFAYGRDEKLEPAFAYRDGPDDDWETWDNPFPGEMTPQSFVKGENALYVASRGGDMLGIYKLDLDTRNIEPLATHETSEPMHMLQDGLTGEVIAVEFEPGYPEVKLVDEDHPTAQLYDKLLRSFPDHQVRITSQTWDYKKAVVATFSDRQPPKFYLFDTEALTARFLMASRPWIKTERMAERKPFWTDARDGLKMQGYLTLPPNVEDPTNLPAIVLVHGGPHGPRDSWAYDGEAQLIASRGYAVMQLNYRGSGGRGEAFEKSGYRLWGTVMQDDVTDATQWLVEQGIANPDRICIYGGSYGGWAALSGITREPDLYACSFAFVGVYDLELLHKKGDIPEREDGREYLRQAVGTDKEDMRARSPIHQVHKIKTPLYVAHGMLDIRAHVSHYHALIKALEKANIPHEKMLVANEGHGFYKFENRVMYYNALLDFFDRHIGSGFSQQQVAQQQ